MKPPRYYTAEMQAWLGGYTPTAAQSVIDDKKAKAALGRGNLETKKRMQSADNGVVYGRGTIWGISRKDNPEDPGKVGRIKRPSQL